MSDENRRSLAATNRVVIGILGRIEALEATDRLAISGDKECERRYGYMREKVNDALGRLEDLEKIVGPAEGSCFPAPRDLSGPFAALCVRVEALEGLQQKELNDQNGRALGQLFRRVQDLEKRDKAERVFNFVAKERSPHVFDALAGASFKADEKLDPTCSTCRWYTGGTVDGRRSAADGACRRHPPGLQAGSCSWSFPSVSSHFWCGDHEFRE